MSRTDEGWPTDLAAQRPPASDRTARRRRQRRERTLAVGALVVYALLAVLAYWPVSPLATRELAGGAAGDSVQAVWFAAWVVHALSHASSPWLARVIDVPAGVNLATNPSAVPLDVLLAPAVWGAGPIAAVNLGLRASLFLTAGSLFLVLRSWKVWFPAAFVGGLIFGFGPFMAWEAHDHLDLTFLALPPLVLWLVVDLFARRRYAPWLVGGVLGVVVALQFMIDAEILADLVVLLAIGAVAVLVVRPRLAMGALGGARWGILSATGAFLVIAGFPLWMFVAGPRHLTGLIQPAWMSAGYKAELAAAVQRTWVGTLTQPNGLPLSFSGEVYHWAKPSAYLGVPLVIAVVLALVLSRRVWTRGAAGMTIVSYLFSLGPSVQLGAGLGSVPMPASVLGKLPFLGDMIPIRFAAFTDLFAAITLALAVGELYAWAGAGGRADPGGARRMVELQGHAAEELVSGLPHSAQRTSRPGFRRLGGESLGVLALVAVAAVLTQPYPIGSGRLNWPTQLQRYLATAVPKGHTVLVLPYVGSEGFDQPMGWQALSRFHYDLVGGYAIVPHNLPGSAGYAEPPPPIAAMLSTAILTSGLPSSALALFRPGRPGCEALVGFVHERRVSTVAIWGLSPRAEDVVPDVAACLGPPSLSTPSSAAWAVRGAGGTGS